MSNPHYKGSTDSKLVEEYKNDKNSIVKVVIYPLALDIAWGGDARYYHKGKDREQVELVQVSWIQIDGSYDLSKLEKSESYSLRFVVSMKPDAFGWSNPVYVVYRVKGGEFIPVEVDLKQKANEENIGQQKAKKENIGIPQSLKFEVPGDASSGDKLEFGLYEIWHNNWKGGLSIYKVVIEKLDVKK